MKFHHFTWQIKNKPQIWIPRWTTIYQWAFLKHFVNSSKSFLKYFGTKISNFVVYLMGEKVIKTPEEYIQGITVITVYSWSYISWVAYSEDE